MPIALTGCAPTNQFIASMLWQNVSVMISPYVARHSFHWESLSRSLPGGGRTGSLPVIPLLRKCEWTRLILPTSPESTSFFAAW